MEAPVASIETWPKVVIVGGGFGGLYAAKELAEKDVRVTLVDRTNHHLSQPWLYQVATAGLSPADIAQPIRHILKEAKNIEVVLGEVDRIDTNSKQVHTTKSLTYSYDYLIVAPGVKSVEERLEVGQRILLVFEAAEMANWEEDRRAALTFVVVGGGPTGV